MSLPVKVPTWQYWELRDAAVREGTTIAEQVSRRLGVTSTEPSVPAGDAPTSSAGKDKWLLWAVLFGGIVVGGLWLFRRARQREAGLPQPEPQVPVPQWGWGG